MCAFTMRQLHVSDSTAIFLRVVCLQRRAKIKTLNLNHFIIIIISLEMHQDSSTIYKNFDGTNTRILHKSGGCKGSR